MWSSLAVVLPCFALLRFFICTATHHLNDKVQSVYLKVFISSIPFVEVEIRCSQLEPLELGPCPGNFRPHHHTRHRATAITQFWNRSPYDLRVFVLHVGFTLDVCYTWESIQSYLHVISSFMLSILTFIHLYRSSHLRQSENHHEQRTFQSTAASRPQEFDQAWTSFEDFTYHRHATSHLYARNHEAMAADEQPPRGSSRAYIGAQEARGGFEQYQSEHAKT